MTWDGVDRRKGIDGGPVFISSSELEVLERALFERGGRTPAPDQDRIDAEVPYDEIAATLNVIIVRHKHAYGGWNEDGDC